MTIEVELNQANCDSSDMLQRLRDKRERMSGNAKAEREREIEAEALAARLRETLPPLAAVADYPIHIPNQRTDLRRRALKSFAAACLVIIALPILGQPYHQAPQLSSFAHGLCLGIGGVYIAIALCDVVRCIQKRERGALFITLAGITAVGFAAIVSCCLAAGAAGVVP